MLTEFENVRQIPGEDRRRLFKDQEFELYIWYDDVGISGFELCYDRQGHERAILWRGRSISHFAVDDGEEPGRAGQTPVLSSVASHIDPEVTAKFSLASEGIEKEIRDLVLEKVQSLTKMKC